MRELRLAWVAEENKVPDFFRGAQCSGMCDTLCGYGMTDGLGGQSISAAEYGWKQGCHFVTPGGLARLL